MQIFVLLIARTALALPLTICTDGVGDGPTLARATQEASAIFASIGVSTQWRTAGRQCPVGAIRVTLSDQTPPDFKRGSLAYALPYEGTHIRVFYDRLSNGRPGMGHHVLAHVLVHEIGHILQGIARHSDEGLMKAGWSKEDYKLMFHHQLNFALVDIYLIHDGTRLSAR